MSIFVLGYDLIRSHSQPVEAAVEPLERWDSYENFNNVVEDNNLEGNRSIQFYLFMQDYPHADIIYSCYDKCKYYLKRLPGISLFFETCFQC